MREIIGKYRQFIYLALLIGILVVWFPISVGAQMKAPSAILNQYRGQRTTWFTNVWPYANTLFGLLATIEFAWSAALMLLEKSDMQSWTAALIRKMMWIGAFYALLIYGRYWIPAIIDSFELIGQSASGTGPMAPSDVFTRGIDLAGALMASSSTAAFFENLGTSIAMLFTGIVTALAFIAITVQFVVAMVESYLIVAAGFIFVGFGGSRWTAPYVERYIGLGVSNGVKIMLLYLLIGTGMNLSTTWMTDAQNIANAASPSMSALEIMGASVIFMMLCWQIPKLFAAVLGGSPALSGGDLVSTSTFLVGGAAAIGSMGVGLVGGARTLAAEGAAGLKSVSTGGSSSLSMLSSLSTKSGTVPPPPSPESASNQSQPRPPVDLGKFSGLSRRAGSQLPPDSGPHATPPKMNIEHHE